MSTVLDSLPEKFDAVYVNEIGTKDTDLLARLLSNDAPSTSDREAVEEVLSASFAHHLNKDYSPTETGAIIDDALGAFLLRWPIESE